MIQLWNKKKREMEIYKNVSFVSQQKKVKKVK